jgi:SAM-dependent methyltransferase
MAIERGHFWRNAKRQLVLELIAERFPGRRDLHLVDIGGAASLIASDMQAFGRVETVEPDAAMVAVARSAQGIVVHQGNLPDGLPNMEPAHVVTLLDVVEHIEDDETALRAVKPLLTPDGVVIITVPALKWLWSDHDVALHHKRRYTRESLAQLFEICGYRIERLSYWTSLLLPLLAGSRAAGKLKPKKSGPPVYDVKVPALPINAVLGGVMTAERELLKHRDMPLGSSLFAVIRPA